MSRPKSKTTLDVEKLGAYDKMLLGSVDCAALIKLRKMLYSFAAGRITRSSRLQVKVARIAIRLSLVLERTLQSYRRYKTTTDQEIEDRDRLITFLREKYGCKDDSMLAEHLKSFYGKVTKG